MPRAFDDATTHVLAYADAGPMGSRPGALVFARVSTVATTPDGWTGSVRRVDGGLVEHSAAVAFSSKTQLAVAYFGPVTFARPKEPPTRRSIVVGVVEADAFVWWVPNMVALLNFFRLLKHANRLRKGSAALRRQLRVAPPAEDALYVLYRLLRFEDFRVLADQYPDGKRAAKGRRKEGSFLLGHAPHEFVALTCVLCGGDPRLLKGFRDCLPEGPARRAASGLAAALAQTKK